jgi:hypothetical protein
MNFVDSLSEQGKVNWLEIYQQFMGTEWTPTKDKRAIHLEAKIEDTAEIAELMKQKPDYSIDVQGRGNAQA